MFNTLLNWSTSRRLRLFALALWLAVAAISALALWHLHREASEAQVREIRLLSQALVDETYRGLQDIEEGLVAVGEELGDGRSPMNAGEIAPILRARASLMPMVKYLWLIDRDGRLLSASSGMPAPDVIAFSPSLEQLGAHVAAVSRPFWDETGLESLVAIAMRAGVSTDGASRWILGGIPAMALLGAFSVAAPGTDARMAVFRNDGARLVGSVLDAPALDEVTDPQRLAGQPTIELRRFSDGSRRLVSVHNLPRFGLRIVLTRDMRIALKSWRETANGVLAGLALLLAVLIVAVRQLERADKQHSETLQALQRQQSRAGRLEALGTLAGSVAHDFNSILAAIVGYAELAQDAAPSGSSQARHLDKVMQAALRGKALVERILAFSRGGAHAMCVFELESIVEEVLTLLEASLRKDILIERDLKAPSARLRGDPTRAFEAIMNLCTNAFQSMTDGGGVLSVQTRRLHAAAPRVLSHSQLLPGDYLSLSVSDQGTGIAPAEVDHLFEPFYTTRGGQAGTGLGLSVVHGVVSESGGAIDVQSVRGQGSRFTLYFPECTDAISAVRNPPPAVHAGAGQRLIVVEDDAGLVAMAEEVLKGLGYAPAVFGDPIEALAALRADPSQFAAVITDEAMPGLRGTQLAKAVRVIAPDLPILLVSGYGGALLASRAASAGVTHVLSKPVERAELARVLHELLRRD